MNLAQLLLEQAGERPTAVAVVDDEGPVEYAELVAVAAGWARWFLGQRLEPGERVAFQLANGRKWLVCYWGASLAGLIAVPINTRNRPAEVDAMMARSGASLLVGESDAGACRSGCPRDGAFVGGDNVSQGEVERVLGGHPGVAEVAVVAAPHDRLGEMPVAFVRLLSGVAATSATSAELETLCRARLAGYKVPRHIVFVDGFNVSGSGKIERFKLRDQASRISAAGTTTR